MDYRGDSEGSPSFQWRRRSKEGLLSAHARFTPVVCGALWGFEFLLSFKKIIKHIFNKIK